MLAMLGKPNRLGVEPAFFDYLQSKSTKPIFVVLDFHFKNVQADRGLLKQLDTQQSTSVPARAVGERLSVLLRIRQMQQ